MLIRQVAYILPTLWRQWDNSDVIQRRQLQHLQQLLKFATQSVPYYEQDAYRTCKIVSLDDWQRLPILRKADLRRFPMQTFLAKRRGRWPSVVPYVTSGSTGEVLSGQHDEKSYDYHTASCVRRFFATGRYLPIYRLAHITPHSFVTRPFEWLGLFRRHVVSTLLPLNVIKGRLLRYKPNIILGYPSMIRDVLECANSQEVATLRSGLRAVFTESELLTDEHRRMIQDRVRVQVYDEYSAFECLNIYFECGSHNCHIAEDRLFVEVVDAESRTVEPGTAGEIIITAFHERAMPLLRYSLGDRGTILPDTCHCGRGFRIMNLTCGREDEHVTLPDGSKVYAANLLKTVQQLEGIKDCYFEQDEHGALHVSFASTQSADKSILTIEIEKRVRQLVAQTIPVNVKATDNARVRQAGKARLIVNYYQKSAQQFHRDS